MELIGENWFPVYNVLKDDTEICLANPMQLRSAMCKKLKDRKDSELIADLLRLGLVTNSFNPEQLIKAVAADAQPQPCKI
jgi:hypothetical protein